MIYCRTGLKVCDVSQRARNYVTTKYREDWRCCWHIRVASDRNLIHSATRYQLTGKLPVASWSRVSRKDVASFCGCFFINAAIYMTWTAPGQRVHARGCCMLQMWQVSESMKYIKPDLAFIVHRICICHHAERNTAAASTVSPLKYHRLEYSNML